MGILKRIVRMVVGTALILLSLALLCTCPILRLTGKDAESFLADADFQVTDSLEVARDDLLHSQDFDRAAIEAAGVDLSEGHVVPLLGAMETAARGFTDGDLSLAELARGALLAQQLLPMAGKLDSTEATEGLFDTLGIEEYDEERFPELAEKKCREIGFVLAKEHWGKGLMPEAVREAVRYLFEEAGLDAILCGHFLWNRQSLRVQEKCGFRHYAFGTFLTRMGAREADEQRILTKEDWLSARPCDPDGSEREKHA